ncbi:alpha-2-macroglobulin [Tenacibaculum holothuriorum]|uniref:Alpha-2-macroglobulin n=1 Tax=Tenacibaculum holothuriorum TaxID=1635173 RepID=A0A1Y2PDE0_9FLAO|nr:MG2 domain-containing protein [Tenacibaculum holothuriorum]OSY88506.1 alpha-2-macroglobulin [Tenacibaculum holothuriorum]
MKKFTSIVLMILFSTLLNAQENYKSLWEEVHKFEIDNLPKSALKIVDKIYDKAEKTQNSPQLIKCLLYKSKFALILEENAQLQIINQFKEHISTSEFPTKNVLENILANLYWQYFQQHRWQFYNRTQTKEKVDKNDFRTWDLNTLFSEIHHYFEASLKNENKLQQVDVYKFGEILHAVKDSKKYRPTLYDFLAHNALDFYKTSESNITKPAYQFKINNPAFLSDLYSFSKLKLETKDIESLQFNALQVFQKLILFHSNKKNYLALANVDFERLNFVKQHATFLDKNKVYLATLKTSANNFKDNEISGLYNYEIAQLYHQQANSYLSNKNADFRFKNKDALAICKQVIQLFPKSIGAKKCKVLQNKITHKTLSILSEKFVPINTNSRLLITYNNVNHLYFTSYKISKEQLIEFNKIYEDKERIKFINSLEKVVSWNNKLRNEFDYLTHTTEIVVPKHNQGSYLIVANQENDLQDNQLFATANIQVTNLALVENNNNGIITYQVVDRNNGAPIKNATLLLQNKKRRHGKQINKKLTTNNQGFAYYKSSNNYNNVYVTVSTKNDKAVFGNFYINKYYKQAKEDNNEYIRIKPFIFTDRSIYRPGQTVYFKTICIQKNNDTSKPFTNEFIEVSLNNVNGEEVSKLQLKLNEFGSASGEFKLPNNGLTGEYSFSIDESDEKESEFYDNADFDFDQFDYVSRISVEEYKRPKFETKFKPITETFTINDSITVNGFAKAFSGTSIIDAKVVYRVHRKVQYPSWWYWRRPHFSSEAQEITHGESTTDASGNFKVKFKAIPDESVNKNDLPIFSYEVTADVTDINGETRSTSVIVKVGYHAMVANIQMPSKLNKEEKNQAIEITTKNLNDENVPAKGTLQIFKLQAPNNPLRKRPWSTPDYQDISEAQFRKLFPHDAYTKEETDENSWKKGKLVFETTFNTEDSKKVILKNIKKWISGKYIAIVYVTDRFNQKVTDKKKFTVSNTTEKSVADNTFFVYNVNKLNYAPGEKVCLQVGSASKDVTVVVQVEKEQEIVSTKLIKLSDNIKNIEIPVTKKDIGGFAIKYYFVNYNSFTNGSIPIFVSLPQEQISITTSTFRDKLQPDSEQTWSFTIKNDKNNKVAAEVLASMYDASLDQFKQHQWQFNPITTPSYYSYGNNANAYQSFGQENFRIFNRNYPRGYYHHQNYDRLNWFGFSFNNQQWVQRQFTRDLKAKEDNTRKEYDRIISGVVEDEGGPLPGVTVLIKGTQFGTETDFDGNYSIKVKDGDILVFSFVGMDTVEKHITDASKIMLEGNNFLEAVVVTELGVKRKSAPPAYSNLMGKVAGVEVMEESEQADASSIRIRGKASLNSSEIPLYIVDGKIVPSFDVNANTIISSTVLKANEAIALYGEKGKNGAVVIITKDGQNELTQVKARKNFQETAFFYPHLTTDKKGNITFSFTTPEALTRWKLQLLAHTKELNVATKTLTAITQKELMVIPNAPRFLREGDKITLSTKIANLSNNNLQGLTQLILTDAFTGKPLDLLVNSEQTQSFSVNKDGNTNISWNLSIPESLQAVQYKIIAKAGDFSDGEQNVLPVLSNRMLITETLPLWVNSNQTKTFSLEKLKNQNSNTLSHHKLTLEITSNPAWYAIQALPYLMEYPYECSEQTFARYYANTLATHITNSNPKIQKVFNQWKSSDALLSNLEKNEELKSLIIQETPWLRDAQSETEQKKRIGLLFDLNKMKNEQQKSLKKLSDMQLSSGGFPWFKGSDYPNIYITNYIASGFGHLKKLGVTKFDNKTQDVLTKAIQFLDTEITHQYEKLLEQAEIIKQKNGAKKAKEYLDKKHIGYFQLQYLYMRSFYKEYSHKRKVTETVNYYTKQATKYWNDFNLQAKGQIALIQFRNGDTKNSTKVLASLRENSITSEELGMYWKANKPSWRWSESPIETQALLIEAFSEIENDAKTIDNLKVWLLKNKQVNRWNTTKATSEAVYALLLQGSDWISVNESVDVTLGTIKIEPNKMPSVKTEAGTGYFKTSWNATEITSKMSDVTISKKGKGIAWGGLYWQYFEDLDKITSAKTSLKLEKKLFKKVNSDTGKKLIEITENTSLEIGDLITTRIVLRSDRDMEFIHMKDMRASGVEPVNVLSRYKWQDGLGYYENTKDAATNFFFDRLPKGVYVFEYDVRVNNAGNFSNGITTIQSMYAPEFSSHSKGEKINVK